MGENSVLDEIFEAACAVPHCGPVWSFPSLWSDRSDGKCLWSGWKKGEEAEMNNG